jgi:acetyltransferase-like isoleucine patch superfamily enzyme
LVIGDNCSISSGVQIYTHDTVKWALTGGKNRKQGSQVRIGNNCYIGPLSVISMGQKIGKCCVIGALSFVNSIIPPNSIVYGIPGKVVGKVRIKGKNVKFDYYDSNNESNS